MRPCALTNALGLTHALAAMAVLGLSLVGTAALATDHVLTIGGGHDPHGNQVSLEKNVLFFSRVLENRLPDAKHTILFADGGDPRRDLQYIDPDAPLPRVDELLARVFNQTEHLVERYRNSEIPQVDGAATRRNIERWFDEASTTLAAGDRVILYVTAHGGRSNDRKRPRNTTLYLWNDEEITVEELAGELDKLPEEVAVVIVMVQCYSGGFADLIFTDADVKERPTRHNRCGFFATSHSRVAAGCTPDIDEADYHEYSSSFWAAMLGETRTGDAIDGVDYDGDGIVSFSEAHAYVLLTSDTIDIPLRTSDALLRAYSTERPRMPPVLATRGDEPESPREDADAPKTVVALRPVKPVTTADPVEELLDAAGPVEAAVIDGLSAQLELSDPDRAAEARALAKRLDDERRRLRGQVRKLERTYHDARHEIESAVLAEWPELAGRWNPEGRRLVDEEADRVVALIESQRRFAEFDRLELEIVDLEARELDLERRWVKCQRLLQALEAVALAHNLPLAAEPELVSRYERLRAAENATLAPPSR